MTGGADRYGDLDEGQVLAQTQAALARAVTLRPGSTARGLQMSCGLVARRRRRWVRRVAAWLRVHDEGRK